MPGVLSATLSLRWDAAVASSWSIEHVTVRGVNEATTGASAASSSASSRSSVFQQISISANQATLALAQRGNNNNNNGGGGGSISDGKDGSSSASSGGGGDMSGVFDFVRWLTSYRNLFSAKCSRCHRMLRAENNDYLPPTHRAYTGSETGVPIHATCVRSGSSSTASGGGGSSNPE